MAYILSADGLLEFQIVGLLHGQTTRNVFHYRIDSGAPVVSDGASYLAALIAQFQANVVANLLPMQSTQYSIQAITGQAILPIRYRLVTVVPTGGDAQGAVPQASCPSGVTFNVSLFAQRAAAEFQARKFFPGLPVTYEENSLLTDEAMDQLALVANGMRQDMTSAGAVAHPTCSVNNESVNRFLQNVVATVPRQILRYQRRREVGKGE